MTYRYSATSIPGDKDNHNLRIKHNTDSALLVIKDLPIKFHAGDTALGDEIWEAPEYMKGNHPQHRGDKWLHVKQLKRIAGDKTEDVDCWMAIVHQSKQISVLTGLETAGRKIDPEDA